MMNALLLILGLVVVTASSSMVILALEFSGNNTVRWSHGSLFVSFYLAYIVNVMRG